MIFEHIGEGFDRNQLSIEDEIRMNKRLSQTMSKVRDITKSDTCIYCGKQVDSFCNSHNVPRFCLENIGVNGEVTGPNAILKLPNMNISHIKDNIGIKSSGTFQIICRECDSSIFQDYENPNNYKKDELPSQKILAQIAMKNYLKFISKRKNEIALYEETRKLCEKEGNTSIYLKKRQEEGIKVSKLDLSTYLKDFELAKKISLNSDNGYYIVYYNLLDYVTPIAVQAPIDMSIDLEGNVINDIFNMDPNYIPAELHLCVFPLESKTVVLMFIKNGENRYKKFYKSFRKLDEETKLGIVNYIIFLYSEDFFLARNISEKVDLSLFKETTMKTPIAWSYTPVFKTSGLADEFSLSYWNTIPNLLSEKYKLR